MRCHVFTIPVLAICTILTPTASPQVPEGWGIASCFRDPSGNEDGGLFLVDPASPGAPVPITGLGPDLTGAGSPNWLGANSVLVRRSDGALLVGEIGPDGTRIHLHLIQLSGLTAVTDDTFRLGRITSPYGGGVCQAAMVPGGKVLVGVFGIGAGPLAGASLGTVDLSSGDVVPVPVTFPLGVIPAVNALCMDPDGVTAWFSMDNGGGSSTLYSVPVPTGGTAAQHATVPSNLSNLAYDRARDVLVGSGLDGAGTGHLFEIDPSTGMVVNTIVTGMTRLNGVVVDPPRERYVVVTSGLGTPPGWAVAVERDGTETMLCDLPGSPSGIDLNQFSLAASDTAPAPGAWLQLATCGGIPGSRGILAAVDVNGVPLFQVLARGTFDVSGAWTTGGPVPLEISGLDVQFLSFGQFQTLRVMASNPVTVAFQ